MIPHTPKGGRSQKVAKSYSLGRRQDSPPVCPNRARSNEGNTRELWVCPKSHHLHPPQHTSCARQNSHGSHFSHFTNKQFHDLTSSKSIPAAAATILGFGLKFIPVPKKSICQDNVDKAIKCFDRDFYLKVHFADKEQDDEEEEEIDKLQVNSTWKTEQLPYKITCHLKPLPLAMREIKSHKILSRYSTTDPRQPQHHHRPR
jgi:hypothetical protein